MNMKGTICGRNFRPQISAVCGASFKELGKKCFGISKLEDKEYLNRILKTVIKDNN